MKAPTAAGEWLDGRSAVSVAVTLEVRGSSLVILGPSGERHAEWPLKAVRVDALHEGGTAHLECAANPHAHATTQDAEFLAFLARSGASENALPSGRRRLAVAVGSAVAVIGLLGALYFAIPWLSSVFARRVPPSLERRLAPEVHGLFANSVCETPDARRALRRLQERIDPEGDIVADVRVVNLDIVNAFALPGGVVLLTRGLLEDAKSADEVAGILAHELAHVKHRHAMAGMIRDALFGAAWAVTLGDYSGLLVVDPETAYNIATLRYSRDAEKEADRTGAEMLRRQRISTQGLAEFFRRLGDDHGEELDWISTHPAIEDRARALAESSESPTKPSLPEESLAALKNACEGKPPQTMWGQLFD